MSKILALDLGDRWIGTALSDISRMFCRPLMTVEKKDLNTFLTKIIVQEKISIIVVGYPKTLKGTHSKQTDTNIAFKEQLETHFPQVQWILWDERLTSKQANLIHNSKTDKQKVHSIAAALILESYLMHLEIQSQKESTELLDE